MYWFCCSILEAYQKRSIIIWHILVPGCQCSTFRWCCKWGCFFLGFWGRVANYSWLQYHITFFCLLSASWLFRHHIFFASWLCRRHLLFESWLLWPPALSNSSLRGHQLFTAARLHRGGCFASQLRSQHCFCHESPHSTVISSMWHLCIFVSRSCLCSSLIMSNVCTYFLFSSLMTFSYLS